MMTESTALTELENEYGYSAVQLRTIAKTIARGATLPELHLFLSACSGLGLNPFLRQIHFVKRNTKDGPVVAIQIGIDGYRSIAEDSGQYAGSDAPQFSFGKDDKRPTSATVTVHRVIDGQVHDTTRTAFWDEYYPGDSDKKAFMWRRMPRNQLAKCAEALALRAAFPKKLSGMHVHEEMDQAGAFDPTEEPEIAPDVDLLPPQTEQSEETTSLNEAAKKSAQGELLA